MRIPSRVAITALIVLCSAAVQAQDSEIELLRSAVAELRSDYEARIAELERRLAVAEQNARQANQVAQNAGNAAGSSRSGAAGSSAFNPAIGVIFQGQAWSFSEDTAAYGIQGFPLGGEAGPFDEGLSLGETELVLNANVDDKFTARLTAALAVEDGEGVIEVEEAWIEATALPAGFGAKFGRFYSGIGYLNSRHAHSWDFADQPLPYQAFLANQMKDDGMQIRWLAPTDLYVEIGAESFRGSSYPAAGNGNSGFGSYSLFAKFGGDVGAGSSWLAGVSYLDSDAVDRASGDEDDPLIFNGDSTLTAADFVWKWSPDGNWKQKNLIVQAEYFWRNERGDYQLPGSAPLPYDADQTGWYAQAVYQPIPRWRFGGRIDGLSSDNPGSVFDATVLAARGSDPLRYTVMTDWSNSEFSRLRFQLSRDESGLLKDTQFGVQYIHSIGAHGAHAF